MAGTLSKLFMSVLLALMTFVAGRGDTAALPGHAGSRSSTYSGRGASSQIKPGVGQRIGLVVAGGTLNVVPSRAVVTLIPGPEGYVGTLANVRVLDGRGTLTGWQVTATVDADRGRTLLVRPLDIISLSGIERDVVPGPGWTCPEEPCAVVLASAPTGGGGGAFEIGASIVLRGADLSRANPPKITVVVRIKPVATTN